MKHFRSKLILVLFCATITGALVNTAINLDLILKLTNEAGMGVVLLEEENGEKGVETDSETETENEFGKDIYHFFNARQNQFRTLHYLHILRTYFERSKFQDTHYLDTAYPPPEA